MVDVKTKWWHAHGDGGYLFHVNTNDDEVSGICLPKKFKGTAWANPLDCGLLEEHNIILSHHLPSPKFSPLFLLTNETAYRLIKSVFYVVNLILSWLISQNTQRKKKTNPKILPILLYS